MAQRTDLQQCTARTKSPLTTHRAQYSDHQRCAHEPAMLSQRPLQHCLGRKQHPLFHTTHQSNSWHPIRTPLHLQRHANATSHGHQPQQQARGRVRASAASASEVLTPHSGYHFDGTNRRFFEGWYFKVRQQGLKLCRTRVFNNISAFSPPCSCTALWVKNSPCLCVLASSPR